MSVEETEMRLGCFESVGEQLCLDFTNTVDALRGPNNAGEQLLTYSDLVEWSRQTGVLSDAEVGRLRQSAREHPTAATAVLERGRSLREAIYRIFSAIAAGGELAPADLAALNGELAQGMQRARIVAAPGGFAWGWNRDDAALDAMLGPIARSAADLLTSAQLRLVRECASPTCGWLFVDATKNHSRRWCNMKTCGNVAKVHRHRSRKGAKGC